MFVHRPLMTLLARAPYGALVLGLAVTIAVTDASAAQPEPVVFDRLIQSSGLIFEGRVVDVDPNKGESDRPRTRISILVAGVYAGQGIATGETFAFDLPEGRLADGRMVEIVEAPRFEVGSTHLVFYTARAWHLTPVVGWQAGLVREVTAAEGRVWAMADGRCVGGLNRHGFVKGPLVAAPAHSPLQPEVKRTGWLPPPVRACLPSDRVREQLRDRIAELPMIDRGPVRRMPALSGRWPLDPQPGGTTPPVPDKQPPSVSSPNPAETPRSPHPTKAER